MNKKQSRVDVKHSLRAMYWGLALLITIYILVACLLGFLPNNTLLNILLVILMVVFLGGIVINGWKVLFTRS